MDKDNVDYLPIWKANSTPEERFMELAIMARKHPERFEKLVVICHENLGKDGSIIRYVGTENQDTVELIGLIEMGKFEVLKDVYGLLQE